jgi:hypothetical protein
MQIERDFAGYGAFPPDPRWPDTARVAVSFVVNVEEGAELSVADGDERNEAVYEVTDEVLDAPDPCRDSHFEYGTRVGYWRIMRFARLIRRPRDAERLWPVSLPVPLAGARCGDAGA